MAENMGSPFLGVPGPGVACIENPDGVYTRDGKHSLYDGPLNYPLLPGDYDFVKTIEPAFKDADGEPPP